jgi:hypothetical protein
MISPCVHRRLIFTSVFIYLPAVGGSGMALAARSTVILKVFWVRFCPAGQEGQYVCWCQKLAQLVVRKEELVIYWAVLFPSPTFKTFLKM